MQSRFHRNAMLRYGRAILVLLLLAPGFGAVHAEENAQSGVTIAGQFDGDKSSLFIATRNIPGAGQQKFAAVAVKYRHLDDHGRFGGSYGVLEAAFTADEWQKFVSLWEKTRAAPRYADRDTLIGDYFEKPDNTRLTLWTSSDGGAVFTMAGNPDAHNQPRDTVYFILPSKDFDAFDDAVKKASAYFGK